MRIGGAGTLKLGGVALLLCLCLALAASSAPAADYVVGARDVLEIEVYEQPDLRATVRVSEEGRINLALIGEVNASGLSITALIKALTAKYKEFIYNPQITVYIREYAPKEIYVLGEVRTPGLLRITGNPTLLEVISQVGGVGENAAENLTVIRKGKKNLEAQTFSVNVALLVQQGKRELDMEMQDGDTIYVPRVRTSNTYFFIFGEVRSPGSFKIDNDMKLNVQKAIALAGGFTEKAAKGKIKITREENGQQTTIKADLTTEIRAQDILIIPESFF